MPSNRFTCPKCDATLKTAHPIAPGKKIRCPKCQTVFVAPPEDEEDDLPWQDKGGEPRAGDRGHDITAKEPLPARKQLAGEPKEENEDRPRRKRKRSSTGFIVGLVISGVLMLALVGGFSAWVLGLFDQWLKDGKWGSRDKTYTLKLRDWPDPGKSYTVRSSGKGNALARVLGPNDQVLKEFKEDSVEEEVYTLVVLEKGDGRPKKYQKTFEKALEGSGAGMNARSYSGRTVLFELQGARYQVKVEGQPGLSPRDRQELDRRANAEGQENLSQELPPSRPVRVGETWAVDPLTFAKIMGEEVAANIDGLQSSGVGKLVTVDQKGGKQQGTIEWDFKLAARVVQGIRLETPAILEAKVVYNGPIDGTGSALTMTMDMKMANKSPIEQAGQKLTLEMNAQMSAVEEQSAERDAAP